LRRSLIGWVLLTIKRKGGEVKTKGNRIQWELLKGRKAKGAMFRLVAPHANQVSVAGDFNNWDMETHAMKKDQAGFGNFQSISLREVISTDSLWMECGRMTRRTWNVLPIRLEP